MTNENSTFMKDMVKAGIFAFCVTNLICNIFLSSRIKQLELENKEQYEALIKHSRQTGEVVELIGRITNILEKQNK